jgi:hypothetical protein
MAADEEKSSISKDVILVHHDDKKLDGVRRSDNILLARLGYKSEFRREFSVGLALRHLVAWC